MNIGDKIVCIDSSIYDTLTKGKIYEMIDGSDFHNHIFYTIKNDYNVKLNYPTNLFISLEEYRNQKIEKLGI